MKASQPYSQQMFDFTGSSLHNENSREMESFLIENSDHFDGQVKKVWEILKRGERLTVKLAMNKYDVFSLPRRILDLRKLFEKANKPDPIKTERVGRIVEYYL